MVKNHSYKKIKADFSIKRLSKTEWLINGVLHHLMYELGSLKWFHMGGENRLTLNYYEDIGEIKNMDFWYYNG